jgi:polyhydroxybutyrate depolymerase
MTTNLHIGLFSILAIAIASAPAAEKIPAKAQTHPVAPGDHAYTIRRDNLDRHYTVHVPPGYDARKPVPVVIMLHGGGGTSRAAAIETGWSAKADQAGFLAVYPDATPPDPSKPSRFGVNGQIWNDGSGRFHAGRQDIDDVGFLRAMLDEITARYAVDARRIFVTGFSNGASMAFRLGEELSSRVAAIAPVAGACWNKTPALKRPVALCYITGDSDPLNPLQGGMPKMASGTPVLEDGAKPPVRESIEIWAKALACPPKPATDVKRNGVETLTYGPGRQHAEVACVTVEGLGHAWAGGRSLLPESMVGQESYKLNATDFICDFFQKHPAPQQ